MKANIKDIRKALKQLPASPHVGVMASNSHVWYDQSEKQYVVSGYRFNTAEDALERIEILLDPNF